MEAVQFGVRPFSGDLSEICTNFPFPPLLQKGFSYLRMRKTGDKTPLGEVSISLKSLPAHPCRFELSLSSPRVRRWMHHLINKCSLSTHCIPSPGLGTEGREMDSRPELLAHSLKGVQTCDQTVTVPQCCGMGVLHREGGREISQGFVGSWSCVPGKRSVEGTLDTGSACTKEVNV